MGGSVEAFTERFRQLGNVPTLPHAATRALAIVNDPQCSVKDFSKVIESDPALATSLLKLVNSSFYGGSSKISNLTMAITRLGLRETQNLILGVSVRSVFRWMPKEQQEERDRLWRHSSLTAALCRNINEKLGLEFAGEEFAAGLSHDLGRIMLAVGYPELFWKIAEEVDTTDERAVLESETQHLGFTHCDLGAWLASLWNLPDELSEAIQFHHTPEKAPTYKILAAVVSLGEEMANYMEATRTLEGLDLSNNPGWRLMCSTWEAVDELDSELFSSAVMNDAAPEAEALAMINFDA